METHLVNLDWAGLEVIDVEEAWELLAAAPVGRLGFVDAGSPVILPVNFLVDGRSLVLRTATGSKLAAAMREQPVCIEVDSWDHTDRSGWSVLAKGIAEHVADRDDMDRLDTLGLHPWANPDIRSEWVRVMVEEVSGRRIV